MSSWVVSMPWVARPGTRAPGTNKIKQNSGSRPTWKPGKQSQESNQRKCKDKFREIILQIKTMDNLFLVQLKIRYININHNIIILISSYPFISLINCPWLLFHGIILLSFYCIFFDCIYFVDAKVSSISTPTVSRISITLAFLILLTLYPCLFRLAWRYSSEASAGLRADKQE